MIIFCPYAIRCGGGLLESIDDRHHRETDLTIPKATATANVGGRVCQLLVSLAYLVVWPCAVLNDWPVESSIFNIPVAVARLSYRSSSSIGVFLNVLIPGAWNDFLVRIPHGQRW